MEKKMNKQIQVFYLLTILADIWFLWGLQMYRNLSIATNTMEKEEKNIEASWDNPINGHMKLWRN